MNSVHNKKYFVIACNKTFNSNTLFHFIINFYLIKLELTYLYVLTYHIVIIIFNTFKMEHFQHYNMSIMWKYFYSLFHDIFKFILNL